MCGPKGKFFEIAGRRRLHAVRKEVCARRVRRRRKLGNGLHAPRFVVDRHHADQRHAPALREETADMVGGNDAVRPHFADDGVFTVRGDGREKCGVLDGRKEDVVRRPAAGDAARRPVIRLGAARC